MEDNCPQFMNVNIETAKLAREKLWEETVLGI